MYQNNFTHTVEPALSSHPRGMAKSPLNPGGNSAKERGGDARRKFRTKPKGDELGVAHLFLTPKRDDVKTQTNEKYSDF